MHSTPENAVAGDLPGRVPPCGRRGAALLFAISMLALFSALGMIYVRYMELELADTSRELREKRARQLAMASLESAAADLRQHILAPAQRTLSLGVPYQIELPTYRSIYMGESGIVVEEMPSPRLAAATYTIFDESGKVNINHAPASVLQKVLGVPGETARQIAASVPRAGQGSGGTWFLHLDDLAARGLAEGVDMAAASQWVTPYSVVEHGKAQDYLNINAAELPVLAAVLDLSPEQVAQVKSKGPFSSAEALRAAVAEARGVPAESLSTDASIGFQSRCFRVVCEGRYARIIDEDRYRQASAEEKRGFLMDVAISRVEAVLLFDPDGNYEVIHWNVDISTST